MGPKQSTLNDKHTESQTIQINHPMFAIAQHIRISQFSNQIRTKIRLANKEQFDEWQKRAKLVPQNDSIMQPIQQSYQSEGFCGDSGIALITYHDYPYLLSDEIENRKGIHIKFFAEAELWYLIYTILSATYTYHNQGRKTGDIRPDNIFINVDGQVKVASVDSWPGEHTNYEKSFFEKQITYLSPEEIKDLQFGKLQEDCNKQLAETFSIGLTILDATTLTNSKELYSKKMKFNYKKLEDKFEYLSQIGYSQELVLVIQSMCEVDSEYRMTARQVLDWLQPYEDSIAHLEEFHFEDIPPKMKAIIQRNQKINSQTQSQKVITTLSNQPVSTYTPTYIPTTNNHPSSILGGLPPLPTISSYIPSTINPLSSYTLPTSNLGLGYQGTFSQPPSTYGSYETAKFPGPTGLSGPTSINFESHNFTLSKIDQQLEMSRKMFPE